MSNRTGRSEYQRTHSTKYPYAHRYSAKNPAPLYPAKGSARYPAGYPPSYELSAAAKNTAHYSARGRQPKATPTYSSLTALSDGEEKTPGQFSLDGRLSTSDGLAYINKNLWFTGSRQEQESFLKMIHHQGLALRNSIAYIKRDLLTTFTSYKNELRRRLELIEWVMVEEEEKLEGENTSERVLEEIYLITLEKLLGKELSFDSPIGVILVAGACFINPKVASLYTLEKLINDKNFSANIVLLKGYGLLEKDDPVIPCINPILKAVIEKKVTDEKRKLHQTVWHEFLFGVVQKPPVPQDGAYDGGRDKWKNYCLFAAVNNNQLDQVQLLLSAGADKKIQNKGGLSLLMIAAGCNYQRMVQLLIDVGVNLEDKNKDGYTALGRAAVKGCVDVAKLLLKAGANIETRSRFGDTPLIAASFYGQVDMVKLLLSKDADVLVEGEKKLTALEWAIKRKHVSCVSAIEQHVKLIHLAVFRGDLAKVTELVKEKAHIEARDRDGNTPLLLAASQGYWEIMEFLLASGAKSRAKNKADEEAFDIVRYKRRRAGKQLYYDVANKEAHRVDVLKYAQCLVVLHKDRTRRHCLRIEEEIEALPEAATISYHPPLSNCPTFFLSSYQPEQASESKEDSSANAVVVRDPTTCSNTTLFFMREVSAPIAGQSADPPAQQSGATTSPVICAIQPTRFGETSA